VTLLGRPRRLADRLARTLMLWVGGVWLLCVVGATWYVDGEINHNFDSEMIESAHRMVDIAVHDLDRRSASGALAAERLPLLASEPIIDDDPVIFQLVDAGPRMLMRSREAPARLRRAARHRLRRDRAVARLHGEPSVAAALAPPRRPARRAPRGAQRRAARPLHPARRGAAAARPDAAPDRAAGAARRAAARDRDRPAQRQRPVADRARPAAAELQSVGEHVNRLLGRLERALDTERSLAANAAHELRTPLAAVRLRLQTALDQDLSRAEVQSALDALATFGHRADKLLQLSRAESSDALARQSVDLVPLAATVAEEFWSSEAARRRLDLEIAEDGVVAARGDVDSLAIALRNLVENALRYSGEARVAIEVVAPCALVVRDDGPGVPAATLETLRHRHVRHTADAAGYGSASRSSARSSTSTAARSSSARRRRAAPRLRGAPDAAAGGGPGGAGLSGRRADCPAGRMSPPRLDALPPAPIEPMLAKVAEALPTEGDWLFEPKWDGFRAIVFRRARREVAIQSRDLRDFDRYFPRAARGARRAAAAGLHRRRRDRRRRRRRARLRRAAAAPAPGGVARRPARRGDAGVVRRLRPARRRRPLAPRGEPGGTARGARKPARRRAPPLHLTPATRDRAVAEAWLREFEGAGLDGVIAKPLAAAYQPGKRAMLKIKHQRTADCVVAGLRWHKSTDEGGPEAVGSLLLGLFDAAGGCTTSASPRRSRWRGGASWPRSWRRCGADALAGHPWADAAARRGRRRRAAQRLPGATSRWSAGKDLSWVPLRPERVCEVRYDHLQGDRFRHATTFLRWRPDKPPRDCRYDQLEVVPPYALKRIFGAARKRG
jgi:two-component system OmpR family sensor kinase